MKFLSLVLLLPAFLLASAADRVPLSKGKASEGAKGASYFLTNDPSGNFVVSSDIGCDGKVTLQYATPTGGKGAHNAGHGIDALLSQGSVTVHSKSGLLAAVNAGDNTVSLLKINTTSPSELTLVGSPAASGGEFPVSVALNTKGDVACALNGGAKNGVQCFKVDAAQGLTTLDNTQRSLGLNQTTPPPMAPPGSVSQVIFSDDDTTLIAAVKGVPPMGDAPAVPGFLAVWSVSQDGSLSENFTSVAPPEGGLLPFSLTKMPGGAILATDPASGYDVFKYESGKVTAAPKTGTIPGQAAICWSIYSPKTKNGYIVDSGTSIISEIAVDDSLNGTTVGQYHLKSASGPLDAEVASLDGADYAYILSANITSIDVMDLSAPGKASSIQTLDFSSAAQEAGLTLKKDNLQGMATYVKTN